MHHLDGASAEILALGLVLAGLAAFTGAVALLQRRRAARNRAKAAKLPPRLERAREWDLVMHRATKELARGPRVEALQADAMVTVEAAEYAYNRLLEDCARHGAAPAPLPAVEPAPVAAVEPARGAEKAPAKEQEPIAA